MSENSSPESNPPETTFKSITKELTQPFIDLFHSSRALWGINLSYLLEGITYFGIVGYLVIYFTDFVKYGTAFALKEMSYIKMGKLVISSI